MDMEEQIVERLETEINVIHPQALEIQLKLYAIFIPILCSTIIFVNLIIVLSSGLILHRRQQPRSTYIFLGNVALSDLLIGIATVIGQYYPLEQRNEQVCCISIGMAVTSTLVSVFTVGLIGVDRYLYILYGLQYQRYISSKRARIMVLATWVIAGIIGFLPAMGIRNPTDNGRLCWFIILVPPKVVLFTTSVGSIPLIVIIVLYSIILKHALTRISHLKRATVSNQGTQIGDLRLFRGGTPANSRTSVSCSDVGPTPDVTYVQAAEVQPLRTKRSIFSWCRKTTHPRIGCVYSANRWRAIKIVLLTTGAFFVTWFPYFLASILYIVCTPDVNPDYCDNLRVAITSPLAILGLSNSLLNPIIYTWWHNGFRESFKNICRGIFGKRFTGNVPSTAKRKLEPKASYLSTSTRATTSYLKSSDQLQEPLPPVVMELEHGNANINTQQVIK